MTKSLSHLRQEIDEIDLEMMALLAKRQAVVEQVLVIKKQENLPARIQSRIDEVIENAASRAGTSGVNPELARTVWSAMVEWFVRHEEDELKKG
jgi:isochorismate pyruvate lyase